MPLTCAVALDKARFARSSRPKVGGGVASPPTAVPGRMWALRGSSADLLVCKDVNKRRGSHRYHCGGARVPAVACMCERAGPRRSEDVGPLTWLFLISEL